MKFPPPPNKKFMVFIFLHFSLFFFILIRDARHPCLSSLFGTDSFIPNDTVLGIHDLLENGADVPGKSCLLLTGPNMGGKSTLLRQVCVCVILAHIVRMKKKKNC